MERKKLAFLVIALAVLTLILGCPSPDGNSETLTNTISGKVIDLITGNGISGAKVLFGSYMGITDTNGNYTISVGDLVTGNFAVYKGVEYSFIFFEGMTSIDPSANPTYNLYMMPLDTSTYTTVTLSGKIYDDGGTEILDDYRVELFIFNSSGGGTSGGEIFYDKTGGTGYTIDTMTNVSNCFVSVKIKGNDEIPIPGFSFFLQNQDLSASISNYDLTQPSTGYTDVTINGVDGDYFTADLLVPGYLPVQFYVEGELSGASSTIVPIYNPDNYPLIWINSVYLPDDPGTNDEKAKMSMSAETAFTSSVNLPLKLTEVGPTATVNAANTANWNGNTLSFTGVGGATSYFAFINDDSTPQVQGMISMGDTALTFTDDFITSVLNPGSGWDIDIGPVWTGTGMDWGNMISQPIGLYNGPAAVPLYEIILIFADDPNTVAVDIIP